jgi:DNA-binding NarL/FixJ family response regulator
MESKWLDEFRKLSPQSKIVFVTQESDADVVQKALSTGTAGYLVKTRVASDLLPAVEAVRQGGQFVSSGLLGHPSTEATDAQGPRPLRAQ